MRLSLSIRDETRREAAVPGIALIFVRHELQVEAFYFHRAVGNWNIEINRRFTKIKSQLRVGHRGSFHWRSQHSATHRSGSIDTAGEGVSNGVLGPEKSATPLLQFALA